MNINSTTGDFPELTSFNYGVYNPNAQCVIGSVTNLDIYSKTFDESLKKEKVVQNRRLVKVIVVDPNENIDLHSAVLVNDAEKFTDLNDQELFFELNMKGLLDAHNVYRTTVEDKKKSTADKTVFLEPARIRDLKMVVVTIAEF